MSKKTQSPSDTQITRMKNLHRICDERFGGSAYALSAALGKDRNQVRFILAPEKPGGRWIGERLAREIERLLNLSRMSLDIDQLVLPSSNGADLVLVRESSEKHYLTSPDDSIAEQRRRTYPLLDWGALHMWPEQQQELSQTGTRLPCHIDLGRNGFVARIEGDAMHAPGAQWSFHSGMFIYVAGDSTPKPGQFVVVLRNGSPLFRRLIDVDGALHLEAINPTWPNRYTKIEQGDRFMGVVVHAGMELP